MAQLTENQLNIVAHLRGRWTDELARFTDNQVFYAYADFVVSDDCDNSRFPEWFDQIADYDPEG